MSLLRIGMLDGRQKDSGQDYGPNPFSWANSLLIHALALTAMLLPFAVRQAITPAPPPGRLFTFTPLVFPFPQLHGNADKTGGGGGSGNRTPLPASRGALPPFAPTQFTPALVEIPKVPPALPMPATLVGPPELNLPKTDLPFGDPNGPLSQLSGGPGTGGSFGNGDGTGIGPGKGPGHGPGEGGGCCEGLSKVGVGGVSAPIPIYSPDPAYSEEARKAKFGGVALLWIVVDAQGRVQKLLIAKHLPMGLDEEAVKTVSTWRFKPALRQGAAGPVQVQVEVRFQLF
jgi:protein TonB